MYARSAVHSAVFKRRGEERRGEERREAL